MAGFWRVTGLSGWLRWIICRWTSTTRSTMTGWPCRYLLYFQTLPTATCRCCWRVVSPALFVSPSALVTGHLQHWEVRLQRLVQRTPQLSNRAPVSQCWVCGLRGIVCWPVRGDGAPAVTCRLLSKHWNYPWIKKAIRNHQISLKAPAAHRQPHQVLCSKANLKFVWGNSDHFTNDLTLKKQQRVITNSNFAAKHTQCHVHQYVLQCAASISQQSAFQTGKI